MPLRLDKVHDYEVGEGMRAVMKGINTAVRIRYASNLPPIYIQNGGFYGEGGDVLDPKTLPPVFWEEAKKTNPQVRRECGLILPDEKGQPRTKGRTTTDKGVDPTGEKQLCQVCAKVFAKGKPWFDHVKAHKKAGDWPTGP